jgi:hypothetical protein
MSLERSMNVLATFGDKIMASRKLRGAHRARAERSGQAFSFGLPARSSRERNVAPDDRGGSGNCRMLEMATRRHLMDAAARGAGPTQWRSLDRFQSAKPKQHRNLESLQTAAFSFATPDALH